MIIIIVIIIVLIIVVIVIIITGLTYFDWESILKNCCPQQTTRLGNIFYVRTTRLQYGDDL